MTDELHFMAELSHARTDARQVRAELERVKRERDDALLKVQKLRDVALWFLTNVDDEIDLTTLVLDTQTRVLQETRNE